MDESNITLVMSIAASLICGAICAAITAPKLRNGIGWFLLGMIFGPIAIVLAVIAPPLKQAGDALPAEMDSIDALTKLADLHDRGVLSAAEFEAAKARLSAARSSVSTPH